MYRFTFCVLFLLGVANLIAQTTAGFENFALPVDSFLDNSGGNGFASGNVLLPNRYDSTFSVWSGWAISSVQDSVTPGYFNQYAAISGMGADGSATYAVGFAFDPLSLHLTNNAAGKGVEGLYVTNATYTYLSMRDGDAFAKRFGGETGDDPDYLLLTIKSYLNGLPGNDSIDFYLADYRFSDNSEDYIVRDWSWIDLTALGDADSLTFSLQSTDVGAFGMNTPAYFCIDNLKTRNVATALESDSLLSKRLSLNLYPNPAQDGLQLDWQGASNAMAEIVSLQGQRLQQQTITSGINRLDIAQLPAGLYLLRIDGMTRRFVKR